MKENNEALEKFRSQWWQSRLGGWTKKTKCLEPPAVSTDQMEIDLLFDRSNKKFYLHRIIIDSEEDMIVGNIKRELKPQQAVEWWIEHFVPEELRPFISVTGKG